jgi:hypothetical protein
MARGRILADTATEIKAQASPRTIHATLWRASYSSSIIRQSLTRWIGRRGLTRRPEFIASLCFPEV